MYSGFLISKNQIGVSSIVIAKIAIRMILMYEPITGDM